MRTKTLLLAAAALSAGALAASAQVYSANTVGYINLTLPAGYSVIANQLQTGDNTIGSILTNGVPDGMTVATWDFANQGWSQPHQYVDGAGWLDPDGNTSGLNMNPTNGVGYLVNLPSAAVITLVGDVPQGTFVTPVEGPLYDVVGSVVPVVSGLSTNGFPANDGMTYTPFINGGGWAAAAPYPYSYIDGAGWLDADGNATDPAPAVGAGFLINSQTAPGNWTRSFTVQ